MSTTATDHLASIATAFPKRRMSVLATGKPNLMTNICLGLLFVALTAVIAYFMVPDLIYDYKVSKDPVIDTQSEIHGSCKTRKFIFVDCDVKIRYLATPGDSTIKEIEHSFWFVSFSPSMKTEVLRYRKDPSMITTSMATDHITNRFLMILGFGLIFGALSTSSFLVAWQDYKLRSIVKHKLILKPILVGVTKIENERNVTFETYTGGIKKEHSNFLRKNERPLFLSDQSAVAVAVGVPETNYFILLDEQLTVLDFTDTEKTEIRKAIAA
ncbi:hypothetical protein H8L32_03655 [Undibacterium sp. CY18W]|uniref:DUF3592 domain-containing protein n=1 Tax=Undibacterium hunanense TaxID=2762292 RepID=A0ABR6ZL05_9BURK|nr:hypothetical protein [Undibacterium hunanense]MBC3916572.1 hypothetical protein [Undibacterium hunanense]